MSVQSVKKFALSPEIQQLPVHKEMSGYWKGRLAVNACSGITSAEMTRLVTRILGAGLICTGVVALSLAAIGVVAWPVGLIAIPSALIASGLIWYSLDNNQYENPEVVEKFRNEALRLNLEGVVQAYGWNDTLRFGILTPELFAEKYRLQLNGKSVLQVIEYYESTLRHISNCSSPKYDYRIPSPRESAKLWRQETAQMTFKQIIETYPLEKLEKYAILEHGELNCIKGLKRDYEVIKVNYDQRVAVIEREFQSNTQVPKRVYDEQCAQADQGYSNNGAVKELQGFELGYTRERQLSQEIQNRSKTEARSRFDTAAAVLTNQGQIPVDQLTPPQKLRYDQLLQELNLAVSQADTSARQRIEQIDARRSVRLGQLNMEEGRARTERVRLIEAAKQQYDRDVAVQRQQKESRLAPIDSAFRSSCNDFDGRYRAYLRIVGANK